jgi:hypothetical protein
MFALIAMQLFTMGLILSEPINKAAEMPEILANIVEDAKNTQNALTGSAYRPGEKGRKTKKNTGAVFPQKKTRFSEEVLCFAVPCAHVLSLSLLRASI